MTGESGTGKRRYPGAAHAKHAIAEALLSPDAPFISLIAPSMRASRTAGGESFGYVKGVLPAPGDRPGAFRGRLTAAYCLDEIHRRWRNAEGQELFTLDRGGVSGRRHAQGIRFRYVWYFATTEEIHSTFLTTFLRRIDSGQPAGSPAP
ncbi:sigma 54-interacting transcriptional regulator [Salmonella enterica subsp. enterica]|nr:sigma 54-interacting transcriptional regulator [Salmonella enterica subsp. enterica]